MVVNRTSNAVLATRIRIAGNFFERLRGLIGSPPLKEGDGFLIPACQGVHTFGMSYPIDVLYLDKESKVLAMRKALRPNSFGKILFRSRSVLELPAGMIKSSGTMVGDKIEAISYRGKPQRAEGMER